MLGGSKTMSTDPHDAQSVILEHVAAIDAILDGIKWRSESAADLAQDCGVWMTDAMRMLRDAVKIEEEFRNRMKELDQ